MVGVTIKPIKRKKKNVVDLVEIARAAVASEAFEVRTDFEKTVATWERKPVFIIQFAPDRLSARVYTENEIYGYVNDGTKGPYPIRPKAPGYPLRFSVPSSPKTKPLIVGSGAGKKGDIPVAAYEVMHPGIKARNFDKVIGRASRREFPKTMQRELKKRIK